MHGISVRFLGTLAVLLAIGSSGSAAPLSDVLHLSDGTVVNGSIVEEAPGLSYTVETAGGERIVYPVDRVRRIEKKLEPAEAAIWQRSIVFLAEGVVFRGVVVERAPGGPVVLELANGRLVHFGAEEIAKIASEPVTGAIVKERPLAPAATRRAIIDFQIVLVQNRLAETSEELEAAAEGSDTRAGLEADVARLREELEALSAERERASEEAAREEQEAREFEEEFGETASGLREARAAVAKRVESCSVPDLRDRMHETLAEIEEKASQIVQRSEVITRTAEPDARLAPILQMEYRNELVGMTANGLWDDPAQRQRFAIAAAEVPVAQRQSIYQENKRGGALVPTLLNAIPFLSVGSWIQGDVLGAGIVMASAIGGAVIVYAAVGPDFEADPSATPLARTGILLVSAGYLYSLLEPFIFVSGRNARLAKALGLRPGGGAP